MFVCQNCKNSFSITSEDTDFYKKIGVPPPTFCWLCRAQRRMAFRNERMLYKRKSDFSGKEIFSMYAPASTTVAAGESDSGYKVYEKEVWVSDQWDPLQYGKKYDFSRPFFEQFNELLHEVPLKNLNVVNGVRSDYSNNFTEPKNCYLCFNGNKSEDCMYSHGLTQCSDCVDVSHLSKCESCYESFWLTGCSRNVGCENCENSFNLWFCKNCVGCSDCVGCVGLRKKQYYIFNRPYSKEEYQGKFKELNLGSWESYQKIKTQAEELHLNFPNKFIDGLNNARVSGNYVDHSKNVHDSFFVREGENLKFCQYLQELPGCKDCYDWSVWGDNGQLMYECHACGLGTQNVRFSLFVQEDSHDIEYSMICSGSHHLFGCVGLRKKEYCIFNTQYRKEEWEALVPKIREHMNAMPYIDKAGCIYKYGEFFPAELAPVAYEESMAQEYFPLNEEEIKKNGYVWRDFGNRNYTPTLTFEKIPDNITDVPDSITDEVISCAHAGKKCGQLCVSAFRITVDELTFHKKLGIPLPRMCHNCRTFERLKRRTGLQLFERRCECAGSVSNNGLYTNTVVHSHGENQCATRFETAYGPDPNSAESSREARRKEILYCEECYHAEVA
ncbi:MAG: hypothetical protein NUV53_01125 [Patescibacteria group bacterium]|nr:hypothetical protein [Patescibacteria group bacterium]